MTLRRPWSYPHTAAAAALAMMVALAAAQPFGAAGPPSATAAATAQRVAATGRLLARVIVRGSVPGSRAAEQAVGRAGGHVSRRLPLIDGVAATVPAAALPRLVGAPGVAAVTPDRRVHVQAMMPKAPPSGSSVQSVYPTVVRATDVWARGDTGTGITVRSSTPASPRR